MRVLIASVTGTVGTAFTRRRSAARCELRGIARLQPTDAVHAGAALSSKVVAVHRARRRTGLQVRGTETTRAMPSTENPFTGDVFLRGGPRDGQHLHVDDTDLDIGLGFPDTPGGLYRPTGEVEETEEGTPTHMLQYEHIAG